MNSKLLKTVLFFLIISSFLFAGESIPQYYLQSRYLLTSPGSFGNGFLGYLNPALVNIVGSPELFVFSTDRTHGPVPDRQWGLIGAVPHVSIGAINHRMEGERYSDYRISLGSGTESFSYGISYGWSAGKAELSRIGRVVSAGMLVRPNPHVSAGLVGVFSQQQDDRYGVFDLGFRPFANGRITFFGDCALSFFSDIDRAQWSTGVAVQPLSGITVAARLFDDNTFSLGMNFNLGKISLRSQTHINENNNTLFNNYSLRIGSKNSNIFDSYIKENKQYVSLQLKGTMHYQKYRLFDKEKNTLTGIMQHLKGAADDKRIAGVALNLSGMEAGKEMIWEIREILSDLQKSGKKVVIYFDQGNMNMYHLASTADCIVMDPEGMFTLEGFAASRTFMKGTLEKLGIGYEEWRFFTYKSASEVLSRESMSEPDREQRLKLLKDFYSLTQRDVCQSRGFSPAFFDTLVNEKAIFLPEEAQKHQLVDTLARWTEIENIISKLEGENKTLINPRELACHSMQRTEWGSLPQVAVVYAVGACAMDTGIKARVLEKTILRLAESKRIKAVILRVDSPGGDPLASDLVAQALKKCDKQKPLIISQGGVAASGGYWISMYGDTIVAAPNTVTGSIGVIGGWLWNQGFGDKIGMQPDFVKVGKHADLRAGLTLPYLGLTLPHRNLTAEEFGIMKRAITTMYNHFIKKVAQGRDMKEAEVDSIGQGRVWSGTVGRENGLIDVIGGLDKAISLAKQSAGISGDKEVEIVEFPSRGWINPAIFKPDLFNISAENSADSPIINYLKMITSHPAKPLTMLPADWVGTGE
ncbi:MAG: S49 family peptidase [bacterium]